jgi:signal transduction histidine kinase
MGNRLPIKAMMGLWRQPPLLAFALALLGGGGWLALMLYSVSDFAFQQYFTSLSFGLIAAVLGFFFLAKLPTGRWWMRIGYEIGLGLAAIGIVLLLYQAAYRFTPPLDSYNVVTETTESALLPSPTEQFPFGVRISQNPMGAVWIIIAFAWLTVRGSGRIYALLMAARKRRIFWEITYWQMLLVVLVVFLVTLLFMAGVGIQLTGTDQHTTMGYGIVLGTNVIIVAGTVGIFTGVALLVVILPVSLLSYLSSRRITRRLLSLTQATSTVREGDYSARVEVVGEDEVARLQADFNAMTETLEKTLRDLAAERDAVSKLLQSRRELFAGVSHELRTPVAMVRGYLESLHRQAAENPELRGDVEIIERETLHLQRMIDDVFLLARTDADQLQVKIAPLEISGVLERTVQAARQQAWQSKKVEVVLDYQPQIPLISADETRLEQILNNLLKNAVRHTLPGGVIAVGAQAEAQMVCLEVKDTGEGIPPEELLHIWERFYRSASARALDQGGAGLGLAMVKELTEVMGGCVEVTSVVGQGSTFRVRLPRVKTEEG